MKLLWRFLWIASVPVWAQVLPKSPTINQLPSREFGQSTLLNPPTSGAPNLIEGREFNTPLGIAFAPSGAMYVADTSNNRVLAWLPSHLTTGHQADLVIGQRDLVSNLNLGPGTSLTSGLTLPSSVAVDPAGNLYVLDDGNNRIVRYPNPFNQTVSPLAIDLVIGQETQSSGNVANQNNPKASNQSLSFSPGGTFLRAAIALDSHGNLWVADAGNNRVLRFPADPSTKLLPVPPAGTEPAADLVLGQPDFVSNGAPSCGNTPCQTNLTILLQPQSLAFDGAGALYVADGFARVLYYQNPNAGVAASQVLGVNPPSSSQPTVPNAYSLGNSIQNAPLSVFATGSKVFVADTQANRVVRYTAPAQFVMSQATPSPQIEGVIGQSDLVSGKVNRGLVEPSATSLSAPLGGAFDSAGNLWVVDTNNNRVLSYPASAAFSYFAATIVVGQTDFPFNSPNLIEGREVWNAGSAAIKINNASVNFSFGGGIAVDKNSNPPHLYIADTFNNRVLGFLDARAVGTDARSILTQKADLVIGQLDLFRSIVNWAPSGSSGDVNVPTQTGLLRPVGLAVDDDGNVWVADSGNGRVLRFPAPFSVEAGTVQTADTVLGQSSFTNKDQSATKQTMHTPYGLAFFLLVDPTTNKVLGQTHLAVSDLALNRVLVFQSPLVTGEEAFTVVGQQDFSSGGASNTPAGLNAPRYLATDTGGRLYVADSGNNRLVVFENTSNIAQTGPSAPFKFPIFNQPQGIAVSQISGEMWVTSAASNTIYHLDNVSNFQTTSTIFQEIGSYGPLSIALDSSENPIVGEAINRVAFYFAQLVVRNAFSFTSTMPLTPGMWAQAAPLGKTFSANDEVHQNPPYPTTVAGLQMLVNGTPSGIYSWEQQTYMNFVIPWEAPTSGTAEFLLFNPTTKEIVAAGTVGMTLADPAFRTTNFQGWGQVLAINIKADGTPYGLNGPQNPINLGDTLQLALTGQGLVANPPADGFSPSGLTSTNLLDLAVNINGVAVPPGNIISSDLDPTYPGSWTINVRVPTIAQGGPPPCNAVSIVVVLKGDFFSNVGYDPNNGFNDIPLQAGSNTCPQGGGNGRVTTFAVKAP
jgi:uncharacterized protein (TIGR03437 family)